MGPLLSSSGCRELNTAGTDSHAVPKSIVFLWNKTEARWNGMYAANGIIAAWLGSLLGATSLQASTAGPKSCLRVLTISRDVSRDPGEELDHGRRG